MGSHTNPHHLYKKSTSLLQTKNHILFGDDINKFIGLKDKTIKKFNGLWGHTDRVVFKYDNIYQVLFKALVRFMAN